jgi:hypothetical protein
MFALAEAEPLWAGLAAYPDDPSGLSDHQVESGFADLQRMSEAVEAKRLTWLAELERRGSFRRDGHLSAAAWLTDQYGMGAGAAKAQVRVATALRQMPDVREAFGAGQITSSAVRLLADARAEHPEPFAEQEEALVEAAQTKGVDELRRVLADWSQAVEGEQALQAIERLRAKRRLDIYPTVTGMVRVEGELDPESGEGVVTALQAMVDADLRGSWGNDLRTPTQRRADALGELARRYLDGPDRPTVAGERPHLTVTVDVETLKSKAGKGELDNTGAIHPEAVRRLACDAGVMRVVMAGPSEPLEVGRRSPVVSSGLRRAVVLRDRVCRFPGCSRPHGWCDAHHVKHWADGGHTSLTNLVLLCRPHHRLVHEGGFRLQMGDGGPVFRRPDGSVLEEHRAPP